MQAITSPSHKIAFPALRNASLLNTLQRCLDRNPTTRVTIPELLAHPFLRPDLAAVSLSPRKLQPAVLEGQAKGAAVSAQQLADILAQLQLLSAEAPGSFDIAMASQELFSQLAAKAGFTPKSR